jgi:hypothetical protein
MYHHHSEALAGGRRWRRRERGELGGGEGEACCKAGPASAARAAAGTLLAASPQLRVPHLSPRTPPPDGAPPPPCPPGRLCVQRHRRRPLAPVWHHGIMVASPCTAPGWASQALRHSQPCSPALLLPAPSQRAVQCRAAPAGGPQGAWPAAADDGGVAPANLDECGGQPTPSASTTTT